MYKVDTLSPESRLILQKIEEISPSYVKNSFPLPRPLFRSNTNSSVNGMSYTRIPPPNLVDRTKRKGTGKYHAYSLQKKEVYDSKEIILCGPEVLILLHYLMISVYTARCHCYCRTTILVYPGVLKGSYLGFWLFNFLNFLIIHKKIVYS